MQGFKKRIVESVKFHLNSKIETLQSEYRLYMESAANETKSTAGDKHDTSKSMMQLEQEKLSGQLNQLKQMALAVSKVDLNKVCKVGEFGSLIDTDRGKFFISISIQGIQIDGENIQCISMQSPIGKVFMQTKVGDLLKFQDKEFHIKSVS
ncbi:MAG TPA: hypothetical protein VGF79_03160 [Bacteroidia bacterium]